MKKLALRRALRYSKGTHKSGIRRQTLWQHPRSGHRQNAELQKWLTAYARLLADMANVEDLTDIAPEGD